MVFTLQMLAEFLREEGFEIQAIDDFDGDPLGPPHRRHTPWHAVGVRLTDNLSAAVELISREAMLHVWTMYDGPATVMARIPLADPECFEKVVATLRGAK